MIEAKELNPIYGNQKNEEYYALRDINLTAECGEMVMDVLTSLEEQTTILVATHDDSILEQADRVIHMWDGVLSKLPLLQTYLMGITRS
jgi:ABC-type antimicrobial peptide transport system, ATPase component